MFALYRRTAKSEETVIKFKEVDVKIIVGLLTKYRQVTTEV